jgi:hypothetical protein
MPRSMKVHVHWMNLMKNQIIQNFQSLKILNERAIRQKNHFFKPFDKEIMFNGFKMFNFRCKTHVKEINMLENMFGFH